MSEQIYDLMNCEYRNETPLGKRSESGTPTLYLFGRDKNGNRFTQRVTEFKPHFWIVVPEKIATDHDIFGRPIQQVICQKPSDVRKWRNDHKNALDVEAPSCEGDILFPVRFMIDRKIFCGFKKVDGKIVGAESIGVPVKRLYFDMEVESPPGIMPKPQNPIHQIVSFQFSSNYTEDITLLLLDRVTESGKKYSEIFLGGFETKAIHDKVPKGEIIKPHVEFFDTEEDLILRAIEFLKDDDPDIPTGWNVNLFDIAYWINRAEYLGLSKKVKELSPLNYVKAPETLKSKYSEEYYSYRISQKFSEEKTLELLKEIDKTRKFEKGITDVRESRRRRESSRIKAREAFDMLDAYKKWSGGRQPTVKTRPFGLSYDLKIVVAYETGLSYYDYGDAVQETRYKKPYEWMKYCTLDAFALRLLDEYTGLIDHFDRLRRIVGCPISWTLYNNRLIDIWLLRIREKPLPTKQYGSDKEKTKGAVVLEPKVGIHEKVGIIDFKAIYPNLIIKFNLSPEMIDPNGKIEITFENGEVLRLRKNKEGLLPRGVRMVVEEREKLRAQLRQLDKKDPMYDKIKLLETLYKFLACSFFGVMGYPHFRLKNQWIKRAILFLGRHELVGCKNYIEIKCKYEILYGDTDSIFVQMKTTLEGEGRMIENFVNNKLYSDHMRTSFGYKSAPPEAKFEELLQRIIFKPLTSRTKKRPWVKRVRFRKKRPHKSHAKAREIAKKRYAALRSDGSIKITGLEPRRSSSPEITRTIMMKWLEIILKEADISKANGLLKQVYDEFNGLPLNKVGIPRGLRKGMERAYYRRKDPKTDKWKTVRNPWVEGVVFMRNRYKMVFREDKKPLLIYMKPEAMYMPELGNHHNNNHNITKLPATFKSRLPEAICITEDHVSLNEIDPLLTKAIDWDKMREKVLKRPMMSLLQTIGYTWDDVLSERTIQHVEQKSLLSFG